jgi:hypothetical protein
MAIKLPQQWQLGHTNVGGNSDTGESATELPPRGRVGL